MVFYKIIKDDAIIDVGFQFFKWNDKFHRMFGCNIDDGEFIGSCMFDGKFYKTEWTKNSDGNPEGFEFVKAEEITPDEFEEIKDLISNGMNVENIANDFSDPIEDNILPDPEEKTEKPMSISEMRELIKEQQKQIEILLNNMMKPNN